MCNWKNDQNKGKIRVVHPKGAIFEGEVSDSVASRMILSILVSYNEFKAIN